MPKTLDNIYIWVFLVNSESVLLLAFVNYMLYIDFAQNCIFLYILGAKNPCFATKNLSKPSCICVFILPQKQHNWSDKNLHNLGMVGRRKLPDPSLSSIFNAASIGINTLWFWWTNFGLKCLVRSLPSC